MTTQFELAHCELYHPHIHGEVYNEDQPYDTPFHDKDYIYSSYLYHGNITLDEFYDLNNCILIQSDTRNISLQLVLNYNINGQTFCIIKTGLLIKFQKKRDYLGRFAPYLERPCFRLATPTASKAPRTM